MTRLLALSSRLYTAGLSLYPPDLRREFGAEMTEVFAEDLDQAWRSEGIAGVIGVWLCAVREMVRIALPSQFENPAIAVPLLSFALGLFVQSGIMTLALRHKPASAEAHGILGLFCEMVLAPSLAAALTSLAVVRQS